MGAGNELELTLHFWKNSGRSDDVEQNILLSRPYLLDIKDVSNLRL